MPSPKSKIAAAILKDAGAPQKQSPDEQIAGTAMDDFDRSGFPEAVDITADETPGNSTGFSGIQRKTGQSGTT